MSATTIDCTWTQKRLNGLNHKKSSIFTGSRKIAKNQGKFRWVIKESSVAGLAGMVCPQCTAAVPVDGRHVYIGRNLQCISE